jgi:acyl carrier protein
MPTQEEIFEKVREELVDALAVEESDVTLEATLLGDLGAESIDLLDIVYRMEKTFEIKIDRGELVPEALTKDGSEFVSNGKLTAAGLEEIKKRIPYAKIDQFAANPLVQNIATVLTVHDLCYLVESKVK